VPWVRPVTPVGGAVAKVFVSYDSEDRKGAGRLHQWLVAVGHEVFLAQDLHDGIAGGEHWRLRLHERLRWADAVVCFLTSAYVASTWCTAEVAVAQSRGSRLVPVLAESGVVHPLLSDIQHIDLTQDPTSAPAALDEALRRVDAAGGFGWPDNQSPFPGLRPFDIEQHRVFFGRASETKELVGLLRSAAEQATAAVLLVVGPSGCGKSSLVRAGLRHVMAQEPTWRTLPPILPGADPVAALARELAAAAQRSDLGWTVAHVHHQLAEHGLVTLADELLLANPGGPARHLLIVVDQFEELLTHTSSGERARFAVGHQRRQCRRSDLSHHSRYHHKRVGPLPARPAISAPMHVSYLIGRTQMAWAITSCWICLVPSMMSYHSRRASWCSLMVCAP